MTGSSRYGDRIERAESGSDELDWNTSIHFKSIQEFASSSAKFCAFSHSGICIIQTIKPHDSKPGRAIVTTSDPYRIEIKARNPAQTLCHRRVFCKNLWRAGYSLNLLPGNLIGKGAACPAHPDRKGPYNHHNILNVPWGQSHFCSKPSGGGVARSNIRVIRSVQQREPEALGAFDDDIATIVMDSVEQRRDTFNAAPPSKILRFSDEANIKTSRHAPLKCRPGSGARAAYVSEVARFSITIFSRDEHSARINDDATAFNLEHFEFTEEQRLVNDTTGGDTECNAIGFGTRWNLAHDDIFPIDCYRMAGIRPPAADEPRTIRGVGQKSHNFTFAFRTVLSPNYNCCWHLCAFRLLLKSTACQISQKSR